jgi:hypothetical protein
MRMAPRISHASRPRPGPPAPSASTARVRLSTPEKSSTTSTSATSTIPSVVRVISPLAPVSVSIAIVTAGECTTRMDATSIASAIASGHPVPSAGTNARSASSVA